MKEIAVLQDWIAQSRHTVFFGGAGVSTESGIPDFRSQDGLYRQTYQYPPEEIISHHFFMQNPEEFYRFYREKMLAPTAQPNMAHRKLAEMEQKGKLDAVITQNIDGLHQKAGSQNVLELHGTVLRNFCMDCGKVYGLEKVLESSGVPRCSCGGIIKPDVVLYEEGLNSQVLEESVRLIAQAELLIVGGTSLVVYPAAGLLQYFQGNKLVLINRDATPYDSRADLILRGPIGETLGQIQIV